jgi:hypothetical protein
MAIAELKIQLQQLMNTSVVFQAIPEEHKQSLIIGLETSDENQLQEMIVVIQEEETNYQEAQKKKMEYAQRQLQKAEELHRQLKEGDKYLLKKDEEEEQGQNLQVLQNMEKQFTPGAAESKPSEPPRKKFLGLF